MRNQVASSGTESPDESGGNRERAEWLNKEGSGLGEEDSWF